MLTFSVILFSEKAYSQSKLLTQSVKILEKPGRTGTIITLRENVLVVKNKNESMCEILDPQGHNPETVHKNYKLHACAGMMLDLEIV